VRITPDQYRRESWLVHGLAKDFVLRDCWRLPFKVTGPFESFLHFFLTENPIRANRAVQVLFGIRMTLGRALGWDARSEGVPGTHESSISGRLPAGLKRGFSLPEGSPFAGFRGVYSIENEALLEISNRTIFALIHICRKDDEVWLGIFTKSRGFLSDLYMKVIEPFRYLIVYPHWHRYLKERWEAIE